MEQAFSLYGVPDNKTVNMCLVDDTSLVWCYGLLTLYQVFGYKIVDMCLV